ncbi:MerR family transcriptional regulator [Actinomyces sp. B33]|uniref:MerR family transcriptional regulator n=1 Tax=Actinomyces sp. B33 TaxID=2942131 RepID=UPI00233FCE45|nr:MerR family transcriptional regulator [Actinomyces sp. B33]MDC4232519.1 MerR family transcriptional regulator [Actinomyces sp. B33]
MNTEETLYTVGEVAETLNVTVRALHHWESQGLVTPTDRSWSNYRLYTPEDVERIQQILIYRATGMRLAEIKQLLADGSSSIDHLRRQREILIDQQSHISEMVRAIDTLLEKEMSDEKLDLDQIGEIIGDAMFAEHRAEAEGLYGDTDDWEISRRRTSSWESHDWAASKRRFEAIDERLVEALRNGVQIESEEAAALVHAHREALSQFFPVTHAKHYLISRCYIGDERFKSYYDNQQEGLAQWLADAIAHVAEANGVDLENPDWA